jgi:hypothetical protein
MASPDPVADADQLPQDDNGVLQNVDDDHDEDHLENDPDQATMDDSASIDLCIEIGSRDMIDIDADETLDLFIDIDPFTVIDNFVEQHSRH